MIERQLSDEEFRKVQDECLEGGHRLDAEKTHASDYDGEPVVVDGKLMPSWMAAVFGELAAKRSG